MTHIYYNVLSVEARKEIYKQNRIRRPTLTS